MGEANSVKASFGVAVIGDVFVDILACVSDDLSNRGANLNCVDPICPHPGGSALNTASHLASLSRNDQWNLSLYGATGADFWEDFIKNHCNKCGLDFRNTVVPDTATAVCIAVSNSTVQSFISHKGATSKFSPSDLDIEELSQFNHIHLGGIKSTLALQNFLPGVVDELKKRNNNLTFSLNINSGFRGDWCHQLIERMDVFVQNREEALSISGKETVREALIWLASRVKKLAIVTLGHEGLMAVDVLSKCMYKIGAVHIHAADTTGCGDAFIAAFLKYWLSEYDLNRVFVNASKAAAFIALKVGACTELLSDTDYFPNVQLHVDVDQI
mmetsp:Transcript_18724/g.22955  ORF Transcript_18724/g.22955 Transcript_18724/m.22955 type:complete len:328 (+) Transcript_18724:80-1063(+)